MTALHIRPVEQADAARWAAMRGALWPDDPPDHHAGEVARFFAGALAEPQAVLVATAAGATTPVGFAELSLRAYADGCSTSPVGYLEGWYVDPAWRRRGVGRALVDAAEEWARGQGCREFASDTELDNRVSTAAHAALGFEEAGVIRCFRKAL